ncbi:MAG: toprim domain-containing protein, partial [Acidimicrobiales bacterium]
AQHAWLAGRGLSDDVLVANRVGADPGPRRMARPAGLPRGGMGVVLPVLDDARRATYFQTRYLGHPRRRYENPATALVGVSPRLAEVRVAGPYVDPDAVVVCEGILDALSAAQAGQRAVAVLGVGAPNRAMADQVVQRFASERLVVAFDGDPAGRSGAERMVELLADAGAGERIGVLEVPGDLNDWLRASGDRFPAELAAAVAAGGARSAGRSSPAIEDAVETIWYRHVLVDDPALARSNGERIQSALEAFGAGRSPPPTTAATAGLDADLGDFAYRFALGDDRAAVAADLDHATRVVRAWTAEVGHEPSVLSAEPEIPAMALARVAAAAVEPAGLSLGVGR